MIISRSLAAPSPVHAGWRLLRGYAISRRLPGSWLMLLILLALVLVGDGWAQKHAPTTLQMLVFLLPVALAAVIGVSLWSPFAETERAAGTWLPAGRALHLVTLVAVSLLVARVATITWVPDGDVERWDLYLVRHTVALVGVALLASVVIDSRLSWLFPVLVAMPGLVIGYIRVQQAAMEGREVMFFHDAGWHPMLWPHDSVVAWMLAIGLFVAGTMVVVRRGERLSEPEETAG